MLTWKIRLRRSALRRLVRPLQNYWLHAHLPPDCNNWNFARRAFRAWSRTLPHLTHMHLRVQSSCKRALIVIASSFGCLATLLRSSTILLIFTNFPLQSLALRLRHFNTITNPSNFHTSDIRRSSSSHISRSSHHVLISM